MQIDIDGIPVVNQQGDQERLDAFLDRLTDEVYGRLPRFARLFLSRDTLRLLLGISSTALVNRIR